MGQINDQFDKVSADMSYNVDHHISGLK